MCVVKGVEVCVEDKLDPKKECDCIVIFNETEAKQNPEQYAKILKQMDWDGDYVHNKCDNCKKIDNETGQR